MNYRSTVKHDFTNIRWPHQQDDEILWCHMFFDLLQTGKLLKLLWKLVIVVVFLTVWFDHCRFTERLLGGVRANLMMLKSHLVWLLQEWGMIWWWRLQVWWWILMMMITMMLKMVLHYSSQAAGTLSAPTSPFKIHHHPLPFDMHVLLQYEGRLKRIPILKCGTFVLRSSFLKRLDQQSSIGPFFINISRRHLYLTFVLYDARMTFGYP